MTPNASIFIGEISYFEPCNFLNVLPLVQRDPSGCALGSVDIRTKVELYYELIRLKCVGIGN